SRRVTTTSWYAIGSVPSELSNTSDTSATLTGRRPVEPWKMTSSILPPRSRRGDCSPRTQRTASEMLDLPQPFGPTMAGTPASNCRPRAAAHARLERQLDRARERLEARQLEPGQSHGVVFILVTRVA